MDLTKITDVKELKSLAYDQMAQLEATQQNLRMLNQRIAELNETTETPKKG
jgi:prefoldin subunit 5